MCCGIVHIGVICMCVRAHGVVHVHAGCTCQRVYTLCYVYVCRTCVWLCAQVHASLWMQSKYNCSTHHCFNSETPQKPTSQGEKLAGRPRAGQGRRLSFWFGSCAHLDPAAPALRWTSLPPQRAGGADHTQKCYDLRLQTQEESSGESQGPGAASHPPARRAVLPSRPLASPSASPSRLCLQGFPHL